MASRISYLFRSKTGFYEYRRKVPIRLRPFFPSTKTGKLMSEWKKSLNTKDEAIAHKRWLEENNRFTAASATAEKLLSGIPLAPYEVVAAGKAIAVKDGVHPQQAPVLHANATPAETINFKRQAAEWNEFIVQMHDEYIDELDRKYRDEDGNELNWDHTDPKVAAYRIMKGEELTTPEPTWSDAVELYISVNKAEKKREIVKEQKWELSTRNLLDKFASSIGGKQSKLGDLDRQFIRNWLIETYPNAGTRNRYNNVFSAVINNWNEENKSKIYNPFSGLSNKQLEQEEAIKRRSFTPEEWYCYQSHILNLGDTQLKLIGLLMLYTGCRTNEAAGLQVRDFRLEANMPHVVFRTNELRRMDKNGLERAVPLMTPVLDAYRLYEHEKRPDKPLFPKYGNTRGFENVSAKLRNVVNELMGIKNPDVVPYSTRHTFRDRSEAANISTSRSEYIMGHKSAASSRIHQKYGTKTPPTVLYEHMTKIFKVTDWGYYED